MQYLKLFCITFMSQKPFFQFSTSLSSLLCQTLLENNACKSSSCISMQPFSYFWLIFKETCPKPSTETEKQSSWLHSVNSAGGLRPVWHISSAWPALNVILIMLMVNRPQQQKTQRISKGNWLLMKKTLPCFTMNSNKAPTRWSFIIIKT